MWIETSNEVYAVIFAKHRTQLVHSVVDVVEEVELATEWTFKESTQPILKMVSTKNSYTGIWDATFFINSY